jgi:uncharacterized membrane protein
VAHSHGGAGGHVHAAHADPDHPRAPLDPAARAEARRGRRRAATVLAAVLLPMLAATVAGLVLLWPDGSRPAAALDFAAGGVTFPRATITTLTTAPCALATGPEGATPAPPPEDPPICGTADVRVDDGPDRGTQVRIDVPPEVVEAGEGAGVILLKTPEQAESPATFSIYDVQRGRPLVVLALIFGVLAVAVARLRGLLALVGLAFAGLVLVTFMLPALVAGSSPLLVGLTASAAIMFVVLYLAHGFSLRTTTALLGTFAGLGLTAVVGVLSVRAAHLTGISSDDNTLLAQTATQLDLRALLTCGIVLAGLGVLNDVTITQASAVWELREVAPDMPAGRLYRTAMRIGRDHIASTIYTIVFAYAGAALPVLLLIELYGQPLTTVLTSADIAEELVRTMASAVGLVMAVPMTTGLAVAVALSGARTTARTTSRRAPEPAA